MNETVSIQTTDLTPSEVRSKIDKLIHDANQVVLGKETEIRLALACLIARGHLLIEDLPGVGKTTLAHLLARILGLSFQRIQFTSDLLPADIIGISIFDRGAGKFRFHHGPVFAQVVLADEINRATPKAQSALLEAMEEHQVTVDGDCYPLPQPFFVIATQNPANQIGTFPLPESQLDRFLMRIKLGYPDRVAERALLKGDDRHELLAVLKPHFSATDLAALQAQAARVTVSDPWLDYLQALLEMSRESPRLLSGLSPRAGLSVVSAARAHALICGRDYVLPEDLKRVFAAVAGHRMRPQDDDLLVAPEVLVEDLIRDVPIP